MQSYEPHLVNESLEMRHPYIQDPFTSDIDPSQVSQPMPQFTSFIIFQITMAVFDRMIAKFRDVLLNEELEPQ